jgi:hypothetical protein
MSHMILLFYNYNITNYSNILECCSQQKLDNRYKIAVTQCSYNSRTEQERELYTGCMSFSEQQCLASTMSPMLLCLTPVRFLLWKECSKSL